MAKHHVDASSPFWLLDSPLLLASASVTRFDMLAHSGLPVEVEPARIDERAIEARHAATGHGIASLAAELAKAKALDVSSRFHGRLVLGADQTLLCEGRAFHKPANRDAARQQLAGLSGREHVLTSAFCLVRQGQVLAEGIDSALMRMRPLGTAFLEQYLDLAGESALGSVGCYQLEGTGSQLFAGVEGSHFTILGLPLLEVLATLRQLGALAE